MSPVSHPAARSLGRISTLLLIAALLAVVVVPLVLNGGASFVGTDDAARRAASELAPRTQPWFGPLWAPPSREVESLLFALQAAAGAGIVGYILGLKRGRAERCAKTGSDHQGDGG